MGPAGRYFCEDTAIAFRMGSEFSAITHSNPTGYLAGGCYAAIIAELIRGGDIRSAIESVNKIVIEIKGGEKCHKALEMAVQLADDETVQPLDAIQQLGDGKSADSALAIGLFFSLLYQDNFRFAIQLAANPDGASDTCASICGGILGAYMGEAAMPKNWLKKLQYNNLIRTMADRIYDATGVMEKYADNDEPAEAETEEDEDE